MAWLRLIFKLALNIKYLTRSKIWIESEEQAGSRSTAVAIETPTVQLHYIITTNQVMQRTGRGQCRHAWTKTRTSRQL